MAPQRKKKEHKLEMAVTWMLGCLLLLISNNTLFKLHNASIGGPWFNLLLSVVILVLLIRIAYGFLEQQRQLKITNSGIEIIDRLEHADFAHRMLRVYEEEGWMMEETLTLDTGVGLVIHKGKRRVMAIMQIGRRNKTKEYILAADSARKGRHETLELWIVTNSSYTDQARREAGKRRIKLVDRKALINLLASAGPVQDTLLWKQIQSE